MNNHISYAYFSILGSVRKNHEDNLYAGQQILPLNNAGLEDVFRGTCDVREEPLFGVFDGMGGESCGEVAAYLAADTMRRRDEDRLHELSENSLHSEKRAGMHSQEQRAEGGEYPERFVGMAGCELPERSPGSEGEEYLDDLSREMNREILSYASENRIRSMGTTAVFILFSGTQVHFSNIGDSRIYRISGNRMEQVTTDQVYRSAFFGKAPLLQYLGLDETEAALLPEMGSFEQIEGERYLLCTDGVTDMLCDQEICSIIMGSDSEEECLRLLRERILLAGAADNATAILCSIR